MADPTNVTLALTEALYTYPELVVLGVGFSILIILAIAGNSLVLAAVARTKRLQNVTNVFVVNLSVCNCLSSLAFILSLPGMFTKTPGYPLQTHVPCVVSAALLYVSFGCGVNNMANIALNHCILITRPRETYQWLYTPKKIALMIVVSWLVPLLATIIPPLFGMGSLGFDVESRTCKEVDIHPRAAEYAKVKFDIHVGLNSLPLIVIVTSYVLIWRHVRRHFEHRQDHIGLQSSAVHTMTEQSRQRCCRRRNDELTIIKNLFLVVVAFAVCFLPLSIMIAAKIRHYQLYAALVLYVSCCINPLIYAAKHPHFRPVMRSMIRCQRSNDQNP